MKRDDHEKIQRLLDGSMSAAEFTDFQQRLRESPDLLKLYSSYALLHHSLSEEYEQRKVPVIARAAPASRRVLTLAWVILAALLLGAAIFFARNKPSRAVAKEPPLLFSDAMAGDFVKGDWRLDFGMPSISSNGMEGENYTAFHPLPGSCAKAAVILVTVRTANPPTGKFHSDGWAGLSFFSKGTEMLFFGDCFGAEPTWGLDIKQGIPIINPPKPVAGARTVTLRYDRRTGDVSLHDGAVPLGLAFCSGKVPAALEFDEIRIGASSGAALALRSLSIRVSRVLLVP